MEHFLHAKNFGIEDKDDEQIMMTSKVVYDSPGRPHRVVLRNLGKEYVTHVEFMDIVMRSGPRAVFVHADYEDERSFNYVSETRFPAGYDPAKKQLAFDAAVADFRWREAKL